METTDIETLERITSKYKIRYDSMEVLFGDTLIGSRLFMAINITPLVKDLNEFEDTIANTDDYDLQCAISIMNLFAHYKHYYKARAKVEQIIIIGYVRDSYTYKKYSKLLDMISSICDYFHGVYFIPDIYNGNNVHIVCACINYMNACATNKHIPIMIHVLSPYNMDKQILNCIPTTNACKLQKELSGKPTVQYKKEIMEKLFKSHPELYDDSEYKPEIDALLVSIGKFLNSMVCSKVKQTTDDYLIKYTVKSITKKIPIVFEFLKTGYRSETGIPISTQFINYLADNHIFAEPVDQSIMIRYLKSCDFRFQNIGVLNTSLAPLIETWKKKIKDYAKERESERYKMLVKHQLYINWL